MKIQDQMPPEWGEWVKTKKDMAGETPKLRLTPEPQLCPCGRMVRGRRVNISYLQFTKDNKKARYMQQSCALSDCLKWYNPELDTWENRHHQERKAIFRRFFGR